jgi:hypothetical protein
VKSEFARATPTSLNTAPCDLCDVLVMLFLVAPGCAVAWDPTFVQRRFIRSLVGPAEVMRRGFGYALGGVHECPPRGESPAERARALRRAADGECEGR